MKQIKQLVSKIFLTGVVVFSCSLGNTATPGGPDRAADAAKVNETGSKAEEATRVATYNERLKECEKEFKTDNEKLELCISKAKSRSNFQDYNEIACTQSSEKAMDAFKKLQGHCSENGFGGFGGKTDCIKSANKCTQLAEAAKGEDEEDIDGQDGPIATFMKNCPVSEEYARTLKDDHKKAKEELAGYKKDSHENKKDLASQLTALKRKIAELDKEFAVENRNGDLTEKKRAADEEKAIMDLSNAIETARDKLTSAQDGKASILAEKADKLDQFSDIVLQADCEAAAIGALEKFPGADAKKSSSTIKSGAGRRRIYSTCISGKLRARANIILAFEGRLRDYDNEVRRMTSALQTMNKNLQKMIQDVPTNAQASAGEKNAVQTKYTNDRQTLLEEMQNLQALATEKNIQLTESLQRAEADVNRMSVKAGVLAKGGSPKTSKKPFAEIQELVMDSDLTIINFNKRGCCTYQKSWPCNTDGEINPIKIRSQIGSGTSK